MHIVSQRFSSLIGVVLLSFASLASTQANSTQAWTEASWIKIQPSKDLQWVDCYTGGLQCTRLQVPLNYSEPDGETAAIALTRLPANVSTDSEDYLGPILINPGGPGGSGVEIIITTGVQFRTILGPRFDIVGFDPRGVHRSTPVISFYESTEERLMWDIAPLIEFNRSDVMTVSYFSAKAQLTGQLALQRDKNVLAHMNTDNTARDMLKITEVYGRDKVQYWGFSYGSILGATFAAMFPDRIHRLAVDGVMDPDADYYNMRWLGNVLDTDKTLQWFFKSCLEGGPEACAFYESSIEAMENKLNGIYESLIRSPIPVQTDLSYGMVDYPTLREALFILLYAPAAWPETANSLQDLSKGNATTAWRIFDAPRFKCSCDSEDVNPFPPAPEASVALACNDGEAVPSGLDEAERHYNEAITEFGSWGSLFAGFRIICGGWPKSIPKNQFRGPVTAQNTSVPLLIIGNTADPATPIEGARNVTAKFPGSVLLTQDGPGHSSLAAPSTCTAVHIRNYFVNGTLPPEGTVCPLDGPIFKKEPAATKRGEIFTEEVELMEALETLANARVDRRGLPPLHV
ncbi:hypothetical protein L218DRAFT_957710 [Marasmius fiardii PR-910]|nr:hypothetical protein L218DRAFT_957710 [Marasmius fiardii PR-910]